MVWKLERKNSERRVHGLKCTGGETVRNFLAKLHSNYFRAVQNDRECEEQKEQGQQAATLLGVWGEVGVVGAVMAAFP